jgi:hypothetical protein
MESRGGPTGTAVLTLPWQRAPPSPKSSVGGTPGFQSSGVTHGHSLPRGYTVERERKKEGEGGGEGEDDEGETAQGKAGTKIDRWLARS